MKSPLFSWYQLGPDRNLEDLSPSQLERLRFTNKFRRDFAGNVKKIREARDRDELICKIRNKFLRYIKNFPITKNAQKSLSSEVELIFVRMRELNGTAPGGRYAYGKCTE
jgi:hypothetical protein